MTTLHVDRGGARRGGGRLPGRPRAGGRARLPARPARARDRVPARRDRRERLPAACRWPATARSCAACSVEGSLPTVGRRRRPRHRAPARPHRARGRGGGGRAPAVLRARIANVERRPDEGFVAELRDGPELIFGAATRLRAKWAAADPRAGRPRGARARATWTCASPAARPSAGSRRRRSPRWRRPALRAVRRALGHDDHRPTVTPESASVRDAEHGPGGHRTVAPDHAVVGHRRADRAAGPRGSPRSRSQRAPAAARRPLRKASSTVEL